MGTVGLWPHTHIRENLYDAMLTIESVGGAWKITGLYLPEDDPNVRQPDIRVAREVLEWEPTITLEEGLRKTVGEFRTRLSQEAGGGEAAPAPVKDALFPQVGVGEDQQYQKSQHVP